MINRCWAILEIAVFWRHRRAQLYPGAIFNDKNPRDGKPYFNTSLFTRESWADRVRRAGVLSWPGINNWNLSLLKDLKLTESKSLEFRGSSSTYLTMHSSMALLPWTAT